MNPSMEPTDRSMLRDTMISTMPVAMMATEDVWTVRFHRLRGVRNLPPDRMWKPIQMTRSASTRPSSRASSSVAAEEATDEHRAGSRDWRGLAALGARRQSSVPLRLLIGEE